MLTKEKIISFVREKTADNPPGREHIRSTNVDDIIAGSPYVLVVEVLEPFSLASEQAITDYMETDIYYCSVVQSLKGDIAVGFELMMVFFGDAVQTGQQYIIAVEPLTAEDATGELGRDSMFVMTSKNSVYAINRLNEISQILSAD